MLKAFSKKQFVVLITLAMAFAFALAPVHGATMQLTEVQLTSTPEAQENPDIDGINVVWQDNRAGNWDIYMYTLEHTFTPETQITNNPASQVNPAVSGDKIVWQDNRNSNWDIYMYDIITKTETQITNNAANQENPDIDGNIIVWQDNRNGNWDIYFYNLTSKTEKRLTSAAALAPYTILYSQNPSISGNIIVYEKGIKETWHDFQTYEYVYCYNLSSGQELDISRASYEYDSVDEPAIYGNSVVWQYIGMIYSKDLSSSVSCQVTSNPGWNSNPAINQNYLVYANNRNNNSTSWNMDTSRNWDIYLTNLDTNIEYQVTNNNASQIRPAVSGGRIVYMDNRNGNWDIYMTAVGYVVERISPPPLKQNGPLEGAPHQGAPIQENPETSLFTTAVIATILVVTIVLVSSAVFFFKKRRQEKT